MYTLKTDVLDISTDELRMLLDTARVYGQALPTATILYMVELCRNTKTDLCSLFDKVWYWKETSGETRRRIYSNPLLNFSVDELELSRRARTVMVRLGVYSIGDLIQKTVGDLAAVKNCGKTTVIEIMRAVEMRTSLRLKCDHPSWYRY